MTFHLLNGNRMAAGTAVPRDQTPHLRISNLSVAYGGTIVVEGIGLEVRRRGITALIGPSGCGKSTLLSCINRLSDLIDGCRATGSIRIGGDEILSEKTDVIRLRRRIGMIFQNPCPFPFSIRKNFSIPLREIGITRRVDVAAAMETALVDVGLWNEVEGRLDRSAAALSGGQKQRLCLARALSLGPEILLLDEPCSGLDPIATAHIENLLLDLGRRLTIVIVTHDLRQARRVADRVAVLWPIDGKGRIIEAGTTEQIFQRPASHLTRAYVGGIRP